MHKTPKLSKQIFIHGLVIIFTLVVIQLLLDALQNFFFLYMPPIGFGLFLFVTYGIQPIVVGVLNIVVLHRLYDCEDWQIGMWLNGFFLLLVFSTVNLFIHTIVGVPFSLGIGLLEIFLISYPFGYLGKFSNRGSKTSS